ncbi:MAG: acylneuraminate cytidylyltransferase family protein [Planctomycetota bacterium]
MSESPARLCIIPARGGSKRLPRKNIAPLGGRPMLAWTIDAAIDSEVFDEVHVSSDDDEILDVAATCGARPRFQRPDNLGGDRVGVVDVCLATLDVYERDHGMRFDELGVMLATAPLRTEDDVRSAAARFAERGDAEFLMAVTRYSNSPLTALREEPNGRLVSHWGREMFTTKRQDTPSLWVDCGAIYLCEVDAFRRERIFYGEKLIGHLMPPERAIDVDEPFDLKIAELLLAERERAAPRVEVAA